MADSNATRGARSKRVLKVSGGAIQSVSLSPETVEAAAFLIASGWSTDRTAVINRAVQALAAAERLVQGNAS